MMSKSLISLALLATALVAILSFNHKSSHQNPFEQWKKNFLTKDWSASQESFRRIIFQRNLEIIQKHNQDSTHSYKMGINQFTVLTDEQFKTLYLNPITIQTPVVDVGMEVTAQIDWVAKGMTAPIKNQGQCGSCWAFSAIASVQSCYRFKSQHLSFSQQQLVDCSGSYGNHGCNGGSHVAGIKYVKDAGVLLQNEYPYVAKTESCKKNGGPHKVASVHVVSGCSSIQNELMKTPLGVAVDAGGWSKYASGVFSNCGTSLNHAVQLVGITSNSWRIKNSWGTSWGESGYIRLALGNTCGMCSSEASWAE